MYKLEPRFTFSARRWSTASACSLIAVLCVLLLAGCSRPQPQAHGRIVVDLNAGDTQTVGLTDGRSVTLTLLEISHEADLRGFIKNATAKIELDGVAQTISVGLYNLPVQVGDVLIDCTITKDYYKERGRRNRNWWNLAFTPEDIADYGADYQKDARFRLWPAGSKLFDGKFVHPIDRLWGASYSQLDNEHVAQLYPKLWEFDAPYYHAQVDIGAAAHQNHIYSPVDGVVVRRPRTNGKTSDMLTLSDPKYEHILSMDSGIFWDRCDYDVTIIDDKGWVYLFGHMRNILVDLGDEVRAGQTIAYTGDIQTQWPHLHFGIWAPQPNGKYGTEGAYAYFWESYVAEQKPSILAVTGPHHIVEVGESVTLTAEGSKSFAGDIVEHNWICTDGVKGAGETFTRTYDKKGHFTEVLRVKDDKGNIAYNISTVYVLDTSDSGIARTWMTYYPSLDVKAGDEVQFEAGMFFHEPAPGSKFLWDFGDDSPGVETEPDGAFARPKHVFQESGHYVVKVERDDIDGNHSAAQIVVVVD